MNYPVQQAPAYGQPQANTGGGQYEKNPNGGYLNPSNYGTDGWYGTIDVTPELLADIQMKGKVLIEVKDVQVSEYGPCRRIVAKPYTPSQKQVANHAPAQPQQGYAPAPQPQANQYMQAPVQTPQQQYGQPVHGAPPPIQHQVPAGRVDELEDEIPF